MAQRAVEPVEQFPAQAARQAGARQLQAGADGADSDIVQQSASDSGGRSRTSTESCARLARSASSCWILTGSPARAKNCAASGVGAQARETV